MEGKTASAAPAVHRVDGTLRMLTWAALLYVAAQQLSPNGNAIDAASVGYIVPLALFVVLTAGLLLTSVPSVAQRLHLARDTQPLLMAGLPLLLLVPYALLARNDPDFDPPTLLITGMAIFLPISCAILNVAPLRRADVTLGLITVAVPLLAPLAQTRELTQVWMRLGAFALPILLLVLSTQAQKQHLNFLMICGVLSLWYSVQFGSLPVLDLLPTTGLDSPISLDPVYYFDVVSAVLLLYALALAGWFSRTGLSFKPTMNGLWQLGLNLILLAIGAGVIGIISGVIQPDTAFGNLSANLANPSTLLTQALITFTVIALPQELLFRGTLIPYLQETFQWPQMATIVVSSLIYGAAHWQTDGLDPSAQAIAFALLAAICGIFFARAYLSSSNSLSRPTSPNVVTSTVLHTIVRLIWRFAFKA